MGALAKLAAGAVRMFGAAEQRPAKTASYMRGEASPYMHGWRPQLRDASDDVMAGYFNAAARTIDALHNSGWISGGVNQAIMAIIGSGLRLNLHPDGRFLGWDEKSTAAWAQDVERRFEIWAGQPYECDLCGRQNLAQISAAALRQYFATGEHVSTIPYDRRPGAMTGTKINLWPSHRLSQESDFTLGLRQGVRMNRKGLVTGYRFEVRDPLTNFVERIDVPSRDRYGRQVVIHVLDADPTQLRGISPLAPALKVIRQFDQLADATLTNALIQAILAATIESSAPTDELLSALRDEDEQGIQEPNMGNLFDARAGWYENTKIDLGSHGKVAHMFPGEKLELKRSETPNDNYEAFAKFLLREVARCLGVTFEQLTGDYSGATYSSVRMSTAEVWQTTLWRRKNIAAPLNQSAFEAWLEEDIELGNTPFPGGVDAFLALRPYICRADWRGPARPQADDLKAAKAHHEWRSQGVLSDEQICNDLGLDWEEVYEQRAREKARRDELGLKDQEEIVRPGGTEGLEADD